MNRLLYILYLIRKKLFFIICKWLLVPLYKDKIIKRLSEYNVKSIQHTLNVLLNTNKSIGRFGDGEIEWILGNRSKFAGLENNSKLLGKKLLNVLSSNNNNFLVALPDSFNTPKALTSQAKFFWYSWFIKNNKRLSSFLNKSKIYYNACITRPYIDYNNRNIAYHAFVSWKKLWKNKNVLIVEGRESRVGVTDDLFKYASIIKRIECPVTNAFKIHEKILLAIKDFLKRTNKSFIVLLALGPTATILAYDLCTSGYRAIDIGNLDLEYEWYLIGAKEKINLPYKYVNENKHGRSALPIHNKEYKSQIVKIINNN